MKAKISYFLEMLKTSFWFLPLVIILSFIGLAFLFIYFDLRIRFEPNGFLLYFLSGGAESARNVLTIIGSAMLGVAGTVFSITLVVLTLASSQFGARLLRNFMYDRLNQVVLGTYVATFIYCILVLKTVKSEMDIEFVPNLSILVAMILAVANIFLLIVYIHHISVSIQADHVISDVNQNLTKSIRTLFPEELGEELGSEEKNIEQFREIMKSFPSPEVVKCARSGYLQAIDSDGLIDLAAKYDLFLSLNYRPGNFLVNNEPLVEVFSNKPCTDELKEKISDTFMLGKVRTPVQDAEFAIHQLVEVAARALSPGVNDPFTAITCIDNLTSSLCYLTGVKFPSIWRYDEEGRLRMKVRPVNFAGMMDAAFNQIRQYGKGSPAVIIRLMEALGTINRFATLPGHAEAVERHAKMVLNDAEESITEENDLNDLRERFRKIKRT
ncbi:MAG: DUF2254 domain-containing protein [Bacteroidales bacterium]|nr:DUF2254 domain-containing protein [Bacteroidales bacterium]